MAQSDRAGNATSGSGRENLSRFAETNPGWPCVKTSNQELSYFVLGYGETASAATEPNGAVSTGEGHSTATAGRQGATKAEEGAGEGARRSEELRYGKREVTGPTGDAGAGIGEKPGFNKLSLSKLSFFFLTVFFY